MGNLVKHMGCLVRFVMQAQVYDSAVILLGEFVMSLVLSRRNKNLKGWTSVTALRWTVVTALGWTSVTALCYSSVLFRK